jgi:hypothetical protein
MAGAIRGNAAKFQTEKTIQVRENPVPESVPPSGRSVPARTDVRDYKVSTGA